MDPADLRLLRKTNLTRERVVRLGWYHSFRFEDETRFDGALSVEVLTDRYAKLPIPADLTGKTVLDIGTWDGWFSFEAERRGAAVIALDMIQRPTFAQVHRKLHSAVTFRELDLFEITADSLGRFNYVFFLGVIYHTKHPLLALEIVCSVTSEVAIVESYVTDADTWRENREDIPKLEFYEADELGGQLDNWCGPTVGCLIAMSRAAGFARTELLDVSGDRASLACYRQWEHMPDQETGPATLKSVMNSIRLGINFQGGLDEYLTCCIEFPGEITGRDQIRLVVGEVGVPTLSVVRVEGSLWSINARLPPRLGRGWYPIRVSVCGHSWSEARQIAVDIAPHAEWIRIDLVCDGRTWARDEAESLGESDPISLWVSGLGDNSDEANTNVTLNDAQLRVTYVSELDQDGLRQVNAELPAGIDAGRYHVRVGFGGVESEPKDLLVRQPTMRGQ